VLSCANNLVSERYRSSLNRSWNCTFLILVLISYLRFDHSYPDNTELFYSCCFYFLLLRLSLSARHTGAPHHTLDPTTHFSQLGYHGITDASCCKTTFPFLFRMGIAAAGDSHFGNCFFLAFDRAPTLLVLFLSQGVFLLLYRLFSCFFAFLFTNIRQNNILFS
jgi:hypothetical protein